MTITNRDWKILIEELWLHTKEHQITTAPLRLRSHRIFTCNICYKKSTPQVKHFRIFTILQEQISMQLIIQDKLNNYLEK